MNKYLLQAIRFNYTMTRVSDRELAAYWAALELTIEARRLIEFEKIAAAMPFQPKTQGRYYETFKQTEFLATEFEKIAQDAEIKLIEDSQP